VLAEAVPRRSHLDDVHMPFGDVGLDLQLFPEVFRHALTRLHVNELKVPVGECRHMGEHRADRGPRHLDQRSRS
jgi:hypothetical protein